MKNAMKKALIAGGVGLALLLTGCTTTAYSFGAVTDNGISKVGEGPAQDGVAAAARAAGITKIATVDYRTVTKTMPFGMGVIGVEQTVIVSGE